MSRWKSWSWPTNASKWNEPVSLNPPPARRLPGVQFQAQPQAPDQSLPRMDIAFFVGFAGSGPLSAAVAVESLVEFETVFGAGLTLAADARSGAPVLGLLHPAVRGFFSQGGRRCWVLRVAGADARTSRFGLPALLTAQRRETGDPWYLSPASLAACSPGSGADTVQVAARVALTPLRVVPGAASTLTVTTPMAPLLRTGDLLRMDFPQALRVYIRVKAASAQALGHEGIVALAPLTGGVVPDSIAITGTDTAIVRSAWMGDGSLSLSTRIVPQQLPQRGSVVGLGWAGDTLAWMSLDTVEISAALAPDGTLLVTLVGRPWQQARSAGAQAFAAWRAGGTEGVVQVLRLDLRTRTPPDEEQLLLDLSLGSNSDPAALGQGVYELPDDDRLFSVGATSGAPASAAQAVQAVLQRDPLGRLTSRFPLASDPLEGEELLLLLPLGDLDDFDASLPALPSALDSLQRDGLTDFDWSLFAEPSLANISADLLPDQAEALHLAGNSVGGNDSSTPTPLRGMHAAFGGNPAGFADEPTLLIVPDALHPGWQPIAQPVSAWTLLPPLPEPPDPCAGEAFRDCAAEPLPRPEFVRGADPLADGSFTLYWTQVIEGAEFVLQEAIEPAFGTATTIQTGQDARYDAAPRKAGEGYYRVRAALGKRLSPWSAPVRIVVGSQGYETLPWQSGNLLALHRLMLRTAAGRGDMLAVLALPMAFDTEHACDHAATLRSTRSDPASSAAGPGAIGDNEIRALSHGALHHPWLMIRRNDGVSDGEIWFAPDGSVAGQLAASALERGAWIAAVANRPLRDVVELSPPGMRPSLSQRQQLLDAQVNLLRSAPAGFIVSSADTLAVDPDWRPINVRRLMCLLRRLALQRGVTYVFEPNGPVLRRTVERGFEAMLDGLYRRGAFAGATAQTAYRVNVGDDVNTPRRRDAGQFWVELKVAPAVPMSFLTVLLSRDGERVLSQETH